MFEAELPSPLAKLTDARQSPVDFFLAAIDLGDDSGNGPTVPGDDERLSALDVIEQLRQAGFGIAGLGRLEVVLDRSYSNGRLVAVWER